jgi:hypothetical protein
MQFLPRMARKPPNSLTSSHIHLRLDIIQALFLYHPKPLLRATVRPLPNEHYSLRPASMPCIHKTTRQSCQCAQDECGGPGNGGEPAGPTLGPPPTAAAPMSPGRIGIRPAPHCLSSPYTRAREFSEPLVCPFASPLRRAAAATSAAILRPQSSSSLLISSASQRLGDAC